MFAGGARAVPRTSVRCSPTPSLRVEATPPPRLHRSPNQISRFALNETGTEAQTRTARKADARNAPAAPPSILAGLVFCQALPSPARRSPPVLSYLPSFSLDPRQQLKALLY